MFLRKNSDEVDEEDVSEIFVRVNSGGIPLKQNDFILTLLSLYWDEGRKAVEQFSKDSLYPSKDKVTSYNQITPVTAQDIIRVVMAYAFDRANSTQMLNSRKSKSSETTYLRHFRALFIGAD